MIKFDQINESTTNQKSTKPVLVSKFLNNPSLCKQSNNKRKFGEEVAIENNKYSKGSDNRN